MLKPFENTYRGLRYLNTIFKIQFVLLIGLLVFGTKTEAQFSNIWPMSTKEGIDFNGPEAKLIKTGINNDSITPYRNSTCYSSSICDCNGNLLFYSNGIDIWNKHDTIMDNGRLRLSTRSNTGALNRNCIIVPIPGNNNVLYYLFYMVNPVPQDLSYGDFCFALIDMSQNNGLGKVLFKDSVVNKNITVSTNLTYARHQNNIDFWIIASANKSTLHAYKVDVNGLNKTPIVSSGKTQIVKLSTPNYVWRYGFIKTTNDYSKLIVAGLDKYHHTSANAISYDFNRSTGQLSNEKVLIRHTDFPSEITFCFDFSPNDSLIYFCMVPDSGYTGNLYTRILQYNRFTDKRTTALRMNKSAGMLAGSSPYYYMGIGLAPDNKLYIAMFNQLYRVNFPNKWGTACKVTYWDSLKETYFADKYASGNTIFAMPNAFNVHRKLDFNSNTELNPCVDTTQFTYWGDTSYYKLTWHFGDGDSLVQYPPFKNGAVIKHRYKKDGLYPIQLQAWHPTCNARKSVVDTIVVKLNPKFSTFQPSNTRHACFADTLPLSYAADSADKLFVNWGDLNNDTFVLNSKSIVNKNHVYTTLDTFAIASKLMAKNSCFISRNDTIISQFNPKPVQKLLVTGHSTKTTLNSKSQYSGCDTLWLNFTDSASGTHSKTIYRWTATDSSTVLNRTLNRVAFAQSGNTGSTLKQIEYTSFNQFNCSHTDTFHVQTLAQPKALFASDTSQNCFKGNGFKLNNLTQFKGDKDSLKFQFYNGEGVHLDSFPEGSQHYLQIGSKSLKLNVQSNSGCSDSFELKIKVLPHPASKINLLTPLVQCFNAQKFDLEIKSNDQYQIQWKDGNQSDTDFNRLNAVLTHSYLKSGKYQILAIARDSNSCADTSYSNISVEELPVPAFDLNDTNSCLNANLYSVTTKVTHPLIDSVENTLHFGNGWKYTQLGNYKEDYKYPKEGQYIITLVSISKSGCVDSLKKNVGIYKEPIVTLKVSDTCLGDSNYFVCQWEASSQIREIHWQSLDFDVKNFNAIGKQMNLKHKFNTAGIYNLKVNVVDSWACTGKANANFRVYNLPKADFSFIKTDSDVDSISFNFTDESNGSKSRIWNFDNEGWGYSSPQRYAFKDTGFRKVTLTVMDQNHCRDSISKILTVYPEFKFFFPTAVSANNDNINDWFGSSSPAFIKEMEMVIYNRWGEIVYSSEDKNELWQPKLEGVYVYRIYIKDLFSKNHYYKGTVTVLR